MSDIVIRVENLYKEYRLGTISHGTLHQDLQSWWARMRGQEDPNSIISHQPSTLNPSDNPHMLALNNVSFEVKRGEVLGIIGRNGAGKSTLLKILSEVTSPTKGQVKIKGRVASLLEVGTGFHPELTGRENIFLNGAILGMTKKEIGNRFDEIVAFAEIDKFIDTPVKRYSSGMYVRLAFAVAAHLEPEILIVDEVLAVGDAQFQKKCLGKMGEVAKRGRTVLFVSHNMTAIMSLCSKSILLEKGSIVQEGESSDVINGYLSFSPMKGEQMWADVKDAPGNDMVRLHLARVTPRGKKRGGMICVDSGIDMEFQFWNLTEKTMLNFSMHLFTIEGIKVMNSVSPATVFPAGLIRGICSIPEHFLNDGRFKVMLMITKDTSTPIIVMEDVLVFDVHDSEREGNWFGKWSGIVRPNCRWETGPLSADCKEVL